MEITAKLFMHGRSQAVRIPKAFQFDGVDEVILRKDGDALVVLPARKTWESMADDVPPADESFLADRPDLIDPERLAF